VITLPVSNIDRALRFYVDQVGFTLDVDYSPNDAFRVVQLTPPGSSCSIQIGKGLTDAPVGSLRNVYLVVTDLKAARQVERTESLITAPSSSAFPRLRVGRLAPALPVSGPAQRSLTVENPATALDCWVRH
jgi:catechol 2,3-dioxygenase-like lactoylglutathione lyase family enzyme